jgi:hypothetical protein
LEDESAGGGYFNPGNFTAFLRILDQFPTISGTSMIDQSINPIQIIQSLLAPAVGISAVGLLLLGLNSRYSIIINRIRLLNEERRRYVRLLQKQDTLDYADNQRFMNISKQTQELLVRSRLVRNAILSLQSAIALFVLTSVALGVILFVPAGWFHSFTLGIFIFGMLSLLLGIVFAGSEVRRSFRIVLLEVKADD